MPKRPKIGDVVYALRRNDNESSKAITIVRGKIVGQTKEGLPSVEWDGPLWKKGDYVLLDRLYQTIPSLFKNDELARWFASPAFGK